MTTSRDRAETPRATATSAPRTCPRWCVSAHGVLDGEEDWLHTSAPVMVAGLVARTCMSIDPDTRVQDGPYVLMGGSELTLAETRPLGESLVALAVQHAL